MGFESFKHSYLFERCPELNILGNWFFNNKNKLKGGIFLNIGITPKNGIQWLNFFIDDLNYKEAFSLEINLKYIYKLRIQNHPYKILNGDVRTIEQYIPNKSVDIIGWFQGPEHIRSTELKETFNKLSKAAKLGFICTTPYGSYYNKAKGHYILNPIPEFFVNLNIDLKIFTWGIKDTKEAGICIYKIKGI